MHRNEGDNMKDEGGIFRFQDQDLPGTPGSTVLAEWGNAVTEEVINLLAEAGITAESSAALDRAAGWTQLRDAIFRSAAITAQALATGSVATAKLADLAVTTAKLAALSVSDGKISDFDLAKAFGGITIVAATPGGVESWNQDYIGLDLERVDGTSIHYKSTVRNDGLRCEEQVFSNPQEPECQFSAKGVTTDLGLTKGIRTSMFPLDKLLWDGPVGSVYTYLGPLTGLLKETEVFGAQLVLEDPGLGGGFDMGATYVNPGNAQIAFSGVTGDPDKQIYMTVDGIDPTAAGVVNSRMIVFHA